MVVEERLRVARPVLDVVGVEVQVDRDLEADFAIAARYVVGARDQHSVAKMAMRVAGDAVALRFAGTNFADERLRAAQQLPHRRPGRNYSTRLLIFSGDVERSMP